MHYRFNQRKDTPFWITARKDADISGAQLLVDAFNELAPLYFRSARARQIIADVLPAATFFQLSGTDIILLGQRVPTRAFEAVEPESDWQLRLDLIRSLAPRALSMIDALRAVRAHPEMLDVLLQSPQSWLTAGDVPLLPG